MDRTPPSPINQIVEMLVLAPFTYMCVCNFTTDPTNLPSVGVALPVIYYRHSLRGNVHGHNTQTGSYTRSYFVGN